MSRRLLEQMEANGYAVVTGVLSSRMVEEIAEEADRLWSAQRRLVKENLRVGLRPGQSNDVVLERLDPVTDISPLLQQLTHDRKLVALAEQALGGPVTVLKDKLIYKWPGCKGYGPHRDEPYFGVSGVPGKQMVSLSIAIDAVMADNGPIHFFPGLLHQHLNSPISEQRDIAMHELEHAERETPLLMPGDALLFNGLIPHMSDVNNSEASRRLFTPTYALATYRDCRERYYAARFQQLSGERRGQVDGACFFE